MEISRLQGLVPVPGIIGKPNWQTPQMPVTFATWPAPGAFSTGRLVLVHYAKAQIDVGDLGVDRSGKTFHYPARITVLWLLKGSHAKEIRGAKSFL